VVLLVSKIGLPQANFWECVRVVPEEECTTGLSSYIPSGLTQNNYHDAGVCTDCIYFAVYYVRSHFHSVV
jgi:hypothetical protein